MTDPSRTFATPGVAAGALFLDPAGRVLLVHPTYKNTWDIPGGRVERGESPATACRREIIEELGLDRTPRRLIAVDWAPTVSGGDKLLFIFNCGDLADDEEHIRLATDELDRWEWVGLDQLDDYVIPRLARRIRTAATLNATGDAYLEHGRHITDKMTTSAKMFAHEAVLTMGPEADLRAPGAAITVALCGHWEHEPPCPVAPHHSHAERVGDEVRIRTVFTATPEQEREVRHLIDRALLDGKLRGPDGTTTTWQLRSSRPGVVPGTERDHPQQL